MRRAIKPEAGVQRAILDLLAAEHVLAFRMNSGVLKTERRFVRFGVPGMADVLAFPGPVLWIECKSDRGRQTAEQASFQRMVESHGHAYLLARAPEDLLRWLRASNP